MVKYMNNGGTGFQQFMAARDANKKPGMGNWLVWILIALLAGWLISGWLAPKQKSEIKDQKPETAAQSEDIDNIPAQFLTGDKIMAKVQGLRVSNIELKEYYKDKGGDAPVSLLSDDNEFLEIGFSGTGTSVPMAGTLWKTNRMLAGDAISMSWRSAEGVEFTRALSMSADYVLQVQDVIANNGKTPVMVGQYARIVRAGSEKSQAGVETGGIARTGGDIEREDWKSLSKKPYSYQTTGGFVGFTDQYWQTLVRVTGAEELDQTMRLRQRSDGMYQADDASDMQSIAPGEKRIWTSNIYAGPKNQSDLAASAVLIPGIEQTIDYGWFWFLARPFLWALNALHGLIGNYGIAIIILTLILRGLMWPLTKKSYSSMAAMQKMQPEMQRIQKLYAGDKARLQMEMLNLYKAHKTSPMGGCLPMILQIPIFFALYKALLISVPMRQAGFLWVSDLAVMDPYFILPVLMGATMWWQQHLQSAAQKSDAMGENNPVAQTQKFMKWMPLIFTAMFAWMPAGLVLYWTVSNLFGIGQMWVIKKQK